ncbi:MAG: L-threonylcarbamoyladenylate synthase [Planctomycetota bacterium]
MAFPTETVYGLGDAARRDGHQPGAQSHRVRGAQRGRGARAARADAPVRSGQLIGSNDRSRKQAGPEQIAEAVTRLRRARLVAFPTETVYGLGADATDADAIERVFEAKGRSRSNPLIVHVSDRAMARRCVSAWPAEASELAEAFWPGPLTLVLPKSDEVPGVVTAGHATVALRAPDHPLALALIETFGRPVVGPSANPSGAVSPTKAAHVREAFGDDVYVLDGGRCRVGIESTVVRVEEDRLRMLRPGAIGPEALTERCGLPVIADAGRGTDSMGSPGRLGPHYRPLAPVVVVEDASEVKGVLAGLDSMGVVLSSAGERMDVPPPHGMIAMPRRASAYAADLYAALREADAIRPSAIVVVRPPIGGETDSETAVWAAVAERLARASSG